jgi:hypothetical protein
VAVDLARARSELEALLTDTARGDAYTQMGWP